MIPVPVHIWLAALVIVSPIPEWWQKMAICLVFILAIALGGL